MEMEKEEIKTNDNEHKVKKKSTKKRTGSTLTELSKSKEENALLKDQLLRKAAEFDNYKKRTEREFMDRVQNANERLISELLQVLDDFDRSLNHAEESNNSESLIQGLELIYKKMFAILEKEGLKPINAVGEEFDPEKHDALMQIESKDKKSGTIIDEHLKGYVLNDKVIRHSQVIVAK
jgi:molecular chaperone GrpE